MRAEAPPSDPIILRRAAAGDVAALVKMEEESFADAAERFSSRRLHFLIAHPRFVVTVAQRQERILGWAAGFVWRRSKIPWGRIYAIAVDPHARGAKLGYRLMEHMLDVLAQRGAQQFFLEVRPDNHAAIALYRKFGFVDGRLLVDYYRPGLDAMRMVRPEKMVNGE